MTGIRKSSGSCLMMPENLRPSSNKIFRWISPKCPVFEVPALASKYFSRRIAIVVSMAVYFIRTVTNQGYRYRLTILFNTRLMMIPFNISRR